MPRHFYGLEYDFEDEVVVTSGGTEALGACILAMAQPGEEFVLVEPTYDSTAPSWRRRARSCALSLWRRRTGD